jgi:hypothetical protein
MVFQEYGLSEVEATRFAQNLLPDILPYDGTRASGYPNGCTLTADTMDWFARVVTREQRSPNRVTAHTGLLESSPYLGSPHANERRADGAASSVVSYGQP